MSWFKDGVEVERVLACEAIQTPEMVARLVIPTTQPQDAGVFTAVAENPAGKATITSRLVVTAPVVTQPVSPPTFLEPLLPQMIKIKSGEPISFEAKVTSTSVQFVIENPTGSR